MHSLPAISFEHQCHLKYIYNHVGFEGVGRHCRLYHIDRTSCDDIEIIIPYIIVYSMKVIWQCGRGRQPVGQHKHT
jgi:hypothetical protein